MEYYKAYNERYKIIHEKGSSWFSDQRSPIVLETIEKYGVTCCDQILEIGCGEGRDAVAVLQAGYSLTATDISEEAIAYCKTNFPEFAEHFYVRDCLTDVVSDSFDFIYAVAVIHMLVLDQDRDGFYQFVRQHLKPNAVALICTMGDGEMEMKSDISQAFELQEREHGTGTLLVAATSCRMVSTTTFEEELERNGLSIVDKGITSALPDFNRMMYAVVRRI